jgi:hypothetical protein
MALSCTRSTVTRSAVEHERSGDISAVSTATGHLPHALVTYTMLVTYAARAPIP